jgi:phosphoglycerate kinase
VLDGFGVAHRAAASVSGVAKYVPSYSGLLLEREVGALEKVMDKPRHPLVLVLGGAKIETKFSLLKEFVKRADTIVLGGAFVSAYLAAQGFQVGGFVGDKKIGKKLLALVQHSRVVFPVDMVVGDADGKRTRVVPLSSDFSVPDTQEFLYDIGPESLQQYAHILSKAHTIMWNGAMGKFEVAAYRKGTVGLVRHLVACARGGAQVIVGGGETVEIVRAERAVSQLSLVSTGGGAMLEFLSKKALPGIRALEVFSPRKSSKK